MFNLQYWTIYSVFLTKATNNEARFVWFVSHNIWDIGLKLKRDMKMEGKNNSIQWKKCFYTNDTYFHLWTHVARVIPDRWHVSCHYTHPLSRKGCLLQTSSPHTNSLQQWYTILLHNLGDHFASKMNLQNFLC